MNGLDFLTAQRWVKEIEINQVNVAKASESFHKEDYAQMEELKKIVIAQNKLIDEYFVKQTKLLEEILNELKNK